MNYPTFGDAQDYLALGSLCAQGLQSHAFAAAMMDCSAGIRPVAMQIYSALPHLITDDPVSINYLYVLLNLILFYFIFALLTPIFSENGKGLKKFSQFLVCALCLLPYIPILMSDMAALSFYCMGIHFLYKGIEFFNKKYALSPKNYTHLLLSGFFFAIAVLFKQNFFIYCLLTFAAFIFVYRKELFDLNSFIKNLNPASCLVIGFSFVLLQFTLTYFHTGYFWLYDIKMVEEPFLIAHSQPNLELIAYSLPSNSAYMRILLEQVNPLMFYLIRFYLGMSDLYLAVYLGNMPVRVAYVLSFQNMLKPLLFFGFYCFFTFLCYRTSDKKCKTLILAAFMSAVAIAVTTHTENRYYLLPRIVLLLSAVEYFQCFLTRFVLKGLGTVVTKRINAVIGIASKDGLAP